MLESLSSSHSQIPALTLLERTDVKRIPLRSGKPREIGQHRREANSSVSSGLSAFEAVRVCGEARAGRELRIAEARAGHSHVSCRGVQFARVSDPVVVQVDARTDAVTDGNSLTVDNVVGDGDVLTRIDVDRVGVPPAVTRDGQHGVVGDHRVLQVARATTCLP